MTHLKLTLAIIFVSWLPITVHAVSIAQVYCGLPDSSHWYWLYDQSGDHETISGKWKTVTLDNARYYIAFEVTEESFAQKHYRCEEGYFPQPGESFTTTWEVFLLIKPNNDRYPIDGYKTVYDLHSTRTTSAFRL
jgi:hypothetical protein